MRKPLKLVQIELYDDKADGSRNGKTFLLHLKLGKEAGEAEIKKVIEEDYGFDMENMWKIIETKDLED